DRSLITHRTLAGLTLTFAGVRMSNRLELRRPPPTVPPCSPPWRSNSVFGSSLNASRRMYWLSITQSGLQRIESGTQSVGPIRRSENATRLLVTHFRSSPVTLKAAAHAIACDETAVAPSNHSARTSDRAPSRSFLSLDCGRHSFPTPVSSRTLE